jgi:hypothetical protein
MPSHNSYGDSIVGKEDNRTLPNPPPPVQVRDNRYDFSDLDYAIDLASRVRKIMNLLVTQQSPGRTLGAATPAPLNNSYGVEVSALKKKVEIEIFDILTLVPRCP